jgi:hypothetical protein
VITPGPKLVYRDGRLIEKRAAAAQQAAAPPEASHPEAAIEKRDYSPPGFLSDYDNIFSQYFVIAACSCLITSASPVISTTTTSTIPFYTDTIVRQAEFIL